MGHDNSWVGAATPSGFQVVTAQTGSPSLVVLHVSNTPTLAGAATFPMEQTKSGIYRAKATGLAPATQFYWGIAEAGAPPEQVGSARTAPVPGAPASFSFWSSTCADTGSNHAVFGDILAHDPDFGMHGGDLHYLDIATNDPALFHAGYDTVLRSPRQGALYRNVPLVYVWDDHDYGPNNSAYNSPSRPAAIAAYRQRVPHLPMPDTEGLWHTFVYGRVRFVMLDVRSMRGKEAGSMLSAAQLQWFKDTMSAATEPLAVIFTGVPWLSSHSDAWGYAPAERLHIAEWLVANGWKDRVVLWAGDAHSISYDDGSHNTFGGLNAPIFQTAALDRSPSDKGGTYTRPPVLNRGQYGLWEIEDTGGSQITMRLHAHSNGSRLYTETLTFAAEPTAPLPQPPSEVVLRRTDGTPVVFQRTDGTSVVLQPT